MDPQQNETLQPISYLFSIEEDNNFLSNRKYLNELFSNLLVTYKPYLSEEHVLLCNIVLISIPDNLEIYNPKFSTKIIKYFKEFLALETLLKQKESSSDLEEIKEFIEDLVELFYLNEELKYILVLAGSIETYDIADKEIIEKLNSIINELTILTYYDFYEKEKKIKLKQALNDLIPIIIENSLTTVNDDSIVMLERVLASFKEEIN